MGMANDVRVPAAHPAGEQLPVESAVEGPVTAETFAGRVHLEWEPAASVTTMGQLAFFIEYLKQAGLFDGFVAGCPLHLTSPNAPSKRDVLGTVLLSVLAGHRRYAHITALRGDGHQEMTRGAAPTAVARLAMTGLGWMTYPKGLPT